MTVLGPMVGEPGLPEGTVTFLFTDIEQSTQRAAALGDQRWADELEAHRDLLRTAFAAHGGVEVGTEGDSCFVAFASAAEAVAAAIDGQRALTGGSELRVRIGMHTGDAVVRDGDYIGHDVHTARRVSDAGHGGQILLSQTTADLIAEGTTSLVDLGPHRLKDLRVAQHLFQVSAPDLQLDFPALRTLDVVRHNLPVQLTSFVGRDRELVHIADMLNRHRLVTLTGVGGCGKTRLAIHAAAAETDAAPDGVFFCDLSRVSDEDSVAPAIVHSFGVEPSSDLPMSVPAAEAVRNHLARRKALLVLDNCEHVVGVVADLVEDLLRSCPGLRVLATSREALEAEGEHAWSVPSLDAEEGAAQLFAERASAVRGTFTLNDDNADDVYAICERLDGIPLAIELAAAQVGHLGPRQIAERLGDRFTLLTGGRRRVQRQQTLQAAMDWSWDLLDERDRVLLRRLAVFQGGCTLDAAQTVCGEGIDVLRGLRSLVAKSLVVPEEHDGDARYRLLETVRLYAEEKLAQSDKVAALRDLHRDHYLAVCESSGLLSLMPGGYRGPLVADQENLRAALRWSETQSRGDLLARLLVASATTFHHVERVQRLTAALELDVPDGLRGQLLAVLAWHEAATTGGPAARTHADEAIALLSDKPSPALALALFARPQRMGIDAVISGEPADAEAAVREAQRAVEVAAASTEDGEAIGLALLGGVLLMLGRHERAAEAFTASIRAGGPFFAFSGIALISLEAVRLILPAGLQPEADAARKTVIDAQRAADSRSSTSFALEHAERGEFDEAHRVLADWIGEIRDEAPPGALRTSVVYFAVVATLEASWERAARLLAFAMNGGVMSSAGCYALYRHLVPKVRDQLGPERARERRDEGRHMTFDEGIDYALER